MSVIDITTNVRVKPTVEWGGVWVDASYMERTDKRCVQWKLYVIGSDSVQIWVDNSRDIAPLMISLGIRDKVIIDYQRRTVLPNPTASTVNWTSLLLNTSFSEGMVYTDDDAMVQTLLEVCRIEGKSLNSYASWIEKSKTTATSQGVSGCKGTGHGVTKQTPIKIPAATRFAKKFTAMGEMAGIALLIWASLSKCSSTWIRAVIKQVRLTMPSLSNDAFSTELSMLKLGYNRSHLISDTLAISRSYSILSGWFSTPTCSDKLRANFKWDEIHAEESSTVNCEELRAIARSMLSKTVEASVDTDEDPGSEDRGEAAGTEQQNGGHHKRNGINDDYSEQHNNDK